MTSPVAAVEKQNPLARAIDSFLSDVKKNEDIRSPFYKEVLCQLGSLLLKDGSPQQTQQCSEALSAYIVELERRQRHESKTMWVAEKLRPLVMGLSQYTTACDVAIQAGPAAAAVLYAGVRLILQLAQKFYQCFDTILDIMADIGIRLQCYELFSFAHSSSTKMQEYLVQSYKNIICFWQKAARILSRKAYKTLLVGLVKPLDAEWQKCREGLDHDCRQVRTFAQALAQAREEKLREQGNLERAENRLSERRRQIIDWLKAGEDDEKLDIRMDLQASLELHQAGTCTWLYQDPSFDAWQNSVSNSAIWYRAGPGSGKTVLSAVLAKHLQDKGLKIAYYSYSFNDPTKRKAITAFRSIALQLLTHIDLVPDKVLKLYETDIANHVFLVRDPRTVVNVLQILLNQCSLIHIILDGLDECYDRTLMKTLFAQMMSQGTYGKVKWFFTSRNDQDLQLLMQDFSVKEIVPSQETIMGDIRRYLQESKVGDDCSEGCIDHWTAASEGNFLWITLTLDTLTGKYLTCEEDIEEELDKFPKGLTGCYLRTLEQISLRSEQQQEVARRIFAILVVVNQPLRLNELLNALSTREGAQDYSRKRALKPSLIEELVGQLIIVNRVSKADERDPFIKFAHKSIYDFFTQSPKSLGVPDRLGRFFVDIPSANLELGRICLTYLNYSRYQNPLDILATLNNDPDQEHAFVKYAATFWFWHLMEVEPSKDLFAAVERFVRSPAFWTCITVQSKTSPHLFGTLIETVNGFYSLGARRLNALEQDHRVNFGSPLPQWIDQYEPSGPAVVRDFLTFVKEWQSVLTSSPHAVRHCVKDVVGSKCFLHSGPLASCQARAFDDCCTDINGINVSYQLQYIRFNNEGAFALFLKSLQAGQIWVVEVQRARLFPNLQVGPTIASRSVPRSVSRSQNFSMFSGGDIDHITLLLIDLKDLSLTRFNGSDEELFGAQDSGIICGNKAASATWIVKSKSHGNIAREEVVVYHCSKNDCLMSISKDRGQGQDSGYASSVSSDSDSDSILNDEDDSYHEDEVSHCLVLVPERSRPLWIPWQHSLQNQIQVSCAFHPTRDISVWSHVAHELCIVGISDGHITNELLPEPVNIKLRSAVAVCKEFHFSPCGTYLYYLLASFLEDKGGTTCSVSLSTFAFISNAQTFEPLRRSCPVQQISYRFSESIRGLSPPFISAHWGTQHLHIAVPIFLCSPKIIKLFLKQDVGAAAVSSPIQTLGAPIYLPSSTPHRSPRILIRQVNAESKQELVESSEYLMLALDTGKSSRSGQDPTQPVLPLTIMDWSIDELGGWRDWNPNLDEQSEEFKTRQDTFNSLRGSFVDSEQRFSIPIRSGLDWTKKAFVSCA